MIQISFKPPWQCVIFANFGLSGDFQKWKNVLFVWIMQKSSQWLVHPMYRKPIRTRQIDATLWDEHAAKKFFVLGWPHLSACPVRDGCMGAEVNNKLTIRFIWVKMRLKLCRTTRSLGKKVFRKCPALMFRKSGLWKGWISFGVDLFFTSLLN